MSEIRGADRKYELSQRTRRTAKGSGFPETTRLYLYLLTKHYTKGVNTMLESTKIYYFSGTGNSLSIAKDLTSTLKNVELLSIAELMRIPGEIVIQGDVIGFVFPVYFGRVPVFVEEFLERASFGNTNYIFAITNGGGAFCRTLKIYHALN